MRHRLDIPEDLYEQLAAAAKAGRWSIKALHIHLLDRALQWHTTDGSPSRAKREREDAEADAAEDERFASAYLEANDEQRAWLNRTFPGRTPKPQP